MNEMKFFSNVPEMKILIDPIINFQELPSLTCSKDSFNILWQKWDLGSIAHIESGYVLYLSRANKVNGYAFISKGGTTGTILDARVIYQHALLSNSCNIIIAHNHPSGNLFPSQADRKITDTIKKAGEFLNIHLLDHLIITPDQKYYSFADEGLL